MKEKDQHYAAMKRILLASMILLPVIPFILALWIGHYHFTSALENSTHRQHHAHRRRPPPHDRFLPGRAPQRSRVCSQHPQLREPRPPRNPSSAPWPCCNRAQAPSSTWGFFDQSGMHVAYQGPFELKWKSYRDEPWFKAVMEKGVYISDIFLGYRKVPHFVIALAKQDGASKWVIRATIDTQMFKRTGGAGADRQNRRGIPAQRPGDVSNRAPLGRPPDGAGPRFRLVSGGGSKRSEYSSKATARGTPTCMPPPA